MPYLKETISGSRNVTLVGGTSGTELSGAATGTQSNVNDTAADTTILAANTSRKGAVVWNDSTSILYLLAASATSSATVWTYRLQPDEVVELPMLAGGIPYTGVLKGIWSVDASGAARVTEWT